MFNQMSANAGVWFKAHGPMIKLAIKTAAAFAGWKLAALGVAFGIGMIKKAMDVLVSGTVLGKVLLIGQALATAAPYIYEHWGDITKFMKDSFDTAIDSISNKFKGFIDTFKNYISLIKSAWTDLKNPFSDGLGKSSFPMVAPSNVIPMPFVSSGITDNFNSGSYKKIMGKTSNVIPMPFISSGINDDINKRSSISSESRNKIRQASSLNVHSIVSIDGGFEVNFNNAPQGMRVIQKKSTSPIQVTPNVGYRSFANGANY